MEDLYARAREQMIEGEMDSHLGYPRHAPEGINSGNSRNGKSSKKVKTSMGEVELEIPRDRNSTFEPILIPKRSRTVEGIEEIVISLYARGMSVRDIELQIRDIYGYTISMPLSPILHLRYSPILPSGRAVHCRWCTS